jgi:hypothetical protein
MQIVIVAPCPLLQAMPGTGTTPSQVAMHLAASTPVRHRVQIVDEIDSTSCCRSQADLHVLLWTQTFSPELIDIAMQLTTCNRLVCIWAGPTAAPVDYLLEFCDDVVCHSQGRWWDQLLAAVEANRCVPNFRD